MEENKSLREDYLGKNVWKDILEENKKMKRGVKNIKKYKNYAPVPERVKAFYRVFPEGAIRRKLIFKDEGQRVIVEARVYAIYNDESTLLANGFSEKVASDEGVDKKSYLENAETKAVGRALINCGFGLLEKYEPSVIEIKDKRGNVNSSPYITVNQRIYEFRSQNPLGRILSTLGYEVKEGNKGFAIFYSKVYKEAFERNPNNYKSEGTAVEDRESGYINPKNCIPNAETSAIGRALGFAGFATGDSIASAEEITLAAENVDEVIDDIEVGDATIGEEGEKTILEYMDKIGISEKDRKTYLGYYKVSSFKELTTAQANRLGASLREQADKVEDLPFETS